MVVRSEGGPTLVLVVLAMVLLLGSVLPAPATAQPVSPDLVWGDDIQLSDSTEISDDPTVALSSDGGMVVAWRERMLGRYSVFFAVLDERGDIVGERHQLGEDLPASMDPVVAVDSSGFLHFVWTALEEQELWYAKASPDGGLVAEPIQLTDAEGDSAECSIWLDARDHLHLVWFDGRDGTTWLYYMQLDMNGVKVVEDTPLVAVRSEEESALAMDSRGDLHIAWNAMAPPSQLQWNSELHYAKISKTGEVLVRDRLVATSRGVIGFPDMSLDLSDNVHLVWPEGLSARERVMYAQLDRSGRTMAGPLEASGGGVEAARDVTIAVDGNDRLHVVWSQGFTQANDLVYVTLAPGGERVGEPVQLTDSVADSREPRIGLSPRGEPRVVWSDLRTGNAEVYLKVASLPYEGVDLAVYSRDITFEPPTVTAGEEVELHVLVHNHGDVDSPRFTMTIYVGSYAFGTVNMRSIDAGDTYLYIGHVTLEEGEHVVQVVLDPQDEVEETVEHNNEASRSVRAYPPGMLIADAGPDIETVAGETTYLDATGTVYMGDGVLSYEWDFDDGTGKGYGLYVEHVFDDAGTFQVTLRVSDGVVEDTDECTVTVKEKDDPPKAIIAPAGHITGDRTEPVHLSASASTDDDGIQGFSWDLGDGSVASTAEVDHLYTATGTYVVTLTVTDTAGQIDINKTTVEVVNLVPSIDDVGYPENIRAGSEVVFTVEASDPDGQVTSYGWDFDARDGIAYEESGSQALHTFPKAGTYNVTLVVHDNDGGSTIRHLTIVVEKDRGGAIGGMGAPTLAMALLVSVLLGKAVAWSREDKKPYQSRDKRNHALRRGKKT